MTVIAYFYFCSISSHPDHGRSYIYIVHLPRFHRCFVTLTSFVPSLSHLIIPQLCHHALIQALWNRLKSLLETCTTPISHSPSTTLAHTHFEAGIETISSILWNGADQWNTSRALLRPQIDRNRPINSAMPFLEL
ncbi:unnamed protein product [Albugo candida]|uniref:Uncharacterized protein n=1 Tax=Albugo candida TaxID=65357 RepID=A0A024GVG7_9STRA|nr:unnamed protein product [Albugo candida]|eukprot:CCI50774.1 unnamed protein product [Albugo candida]